MKQQEYRVRFATPAFLGNAEQAAQWRTPWRDNPERSKS